MLDPLTQRSEPVGPQETKFLPGLVINDCYLIKEKLGEGGSATIYVARNLILEDEVALKVWHEYLASDSSHRERFKREAQICARLQHPRILRVKAYGITADRPFIVMEFVRGRTLEELVKSQGAVPIRDAVSLFKGLAEALSYAHKNDVLHRDIKPANIVLEHNDCATPKLLDFGLARTLMPRDGQSSTSTATMAGTPAYMSPEQCKDEELDARSDIYSLGATMFEAFTGVRLFQADTDYALMTMHLNNAPMFPPEPPVPKELQKILQKCLQKNPDSRYQCAEDTLSDLQALDTTQMELAASQSKKNPTFVALLAVIGLASAALLGYAAMLLHGNQAMNSKFIIPSTYSPQSEHKRIGSDKLDAGYLLKEAVQKFTNKRRQDPDGRIRNLFESSINAAAQAGNHEQLAISQAETASYFATLSNKAESLHFAKMAIATATKYQCPEFAKYYVYLYAGQAYAIQDNQFDKAEAIFKQARKALENCGSTEAIAFRKGILMEFIANFYRQHRKRASEAGALSEALLCDPSSFPALNKRSIRLAAITQSYDPQTFDRALKLYEANRHNPVVDTSADLMRIARYYADRSKLNEAIKIARYAKDDLRRDPEPTSLRAETTEVLVFLTLTSARVKDFTSAKRYRDELTSKYNKYLSKQDRAAIDKIPGS